MTLKCINWMTSFQTFLLDLIKIITKIYTNSLMGQAFEIYLMPKVC